MPISESIKKEIERFSLSKNPSGMVPYLTDQLKKGETTAQDVLDYARACRYTEKQGNPDVINAVFINLLGVVVSSLDDDEQKKLSVQFYALAAERDSSWGSRNYAQCLLSGRYVKKSPEEALKYARKAVESVKGSKTEEHEYKFLLCKILRANENYQEANIAIMEYFVFIFQKFQSEKNLTKKKKIEEKLEAAVKLIDEIVAEIFADFEAENSNDLTDERCKANLLELQPILQPMIVYDKFLSIKQAAYFLKGKCHENLGQHSAAWGAYCSVKNNKLRSYKEAIVARKNLLKSKVKSQSERSASSSGKDELNMEEEKSPDLILPQGIPLPLKFAKSWIEEAKWFHSANKYAIDAEHNKRLAQVKKLITAKEEEISLVKENLNNIETADELRQKKETLELELEKFQTVVQRLTREYHKYLPENRQVHRRHATESRFFNPSRSRKKSEIVKLAENIIDYRFKTDDDVVEPVVLKGKSARLLISAERLFQEAVIALSGDNSLQLGIPKVKEKKWAIRNDSCNRSGATGYGPVEYYQVEGTTVQSEHRTSPKRQRVGDSFLPEHGAYTNDIYPFLAKLTSDETENEKRLANFMIRYAHTHQSITLEELKTIYDSADENCVHKFNKICFLIMEKEQAQWHSVTSKDLQLGMSVAQARCLIMVEAGFISFKEAFKNNVLFGVYSNTGIIDNPSKVAGSCQHIEDLYMLYLQSKRSQDYMKFFKKHIEKDVPAPVCVLTREQAHQDMQHVYGGASDTEDEGYATDFSI